MTSEATAVPIVRADGRAPDQLRPISITRGWSTQAEGSALIEFGNTRVLCTASLTAGVPRWLKGEGRGWVTADWRTSDEGRRLLRRAQEARVVRRDVTFDDLVCVATAISLASPQGTKARIKHLVDVFVDGVVAR